MKTTEEFRSSHYRLVIFDCDGVLVDSEPLANRILANCFQAEGFPISYNTCLLKMVGLSLANCCQLAEDWYDKKLPANFIESVQIQTYKIFQEELKPIPGILDAIKAIPIPRCVASSSDKTKISLSLHLTGLSQFFGAHVYSAEQVARGKPFPDLFLFAANQMNVEPKYCVVIEDSVYGARAAKAAGMSVLGFTGSGFSQQFFEDGVQMFDNMQSLPILLGYRPNNLDT